MNPTDIALLVKESAEALKKTVWSAGDVRGFYTGNDSNWSFFVVGDGIKAEATATKGTIILRLPPAIALEAYKTAEKACK